MTMAATEDFIDTLNMYLQCVLVVWSVTNENPFFS